MDFGVVLQATPPAARVIELARQAEQRGFRAVWTFDSHLLWEEPYVIHSQILAATRTVTVGPMVTNPALGIPAAPTAAKMAVAATMSCCPKSRDIP